MEVCIKRWHLGQRLLLGLRRLAGALPLAWGATSSLLAAISVGLDRLLLSDWTWLYWLCWWAPWYLMVAVMVLIARSVITSARGCLLVAGSLL